MSTIWTLTVDDNESITTTVHDSQAAVFAALRTNYDADGELADLDDGDMTQSLIDTQGLVIYIGDHETPVPAPTRIRVRTREVNEGGNDFDLADIEDAAKTTLAAAGSLDALFEAALENDDILRDRLNRYDECVDYERTITFIRDED